MNLHRMDNNWQAKAVSLALKKHSNQEYGSGLSYGVHITSCVVWMDRLLQHAWDEFACLLSEHENLKCLETRFMHLRIAMPLHDIIEDTDLVHGDLAKQFPSEVADMVFAVSGHGRTRQDRTACQEQQMLQCPLACLVKFCDRLANLEACMLTDDTRYNRYLEEAKSLYAFVKQNIIVLECVSSNTLLEELLISGASFFHTAIGDIETQYDTAFTNRLPNELERLENVPE